MMGMASDLRRAGSSENSAVPTALRALLAVFPALKRRTIGSRPLRGLDFGGVLRLAPDFAEASIAPAGLAPCRSLPTAYAVGYSSSAAARLGIISSSAARLGILCALCAGLVLPAAAQNTTANPNN